MRYVAVCACVFVYPFNDNADKYTAYFYLACNHLETKSVSCAFCSICQVQLQWRYKCYYLYYIYCIYNTYILYDMGTIVGLFALLSRFYFYVFPFTITMMIIITCSWSYFGCVQCQTRRRGREGSDPCVSPVQVCCYGDACIAADCMQCNRRGAPPESIHDVETVHDGGASASGLHNYTYIYTYMCHPCLPIAICVCE